MKRGFTLVELAIVIVIAGILAAVAIPIYQGIVEKSKWSEGKSNAGLIQAAFKVVKAENSGTLGSYSGAATDVVVYTDLDLEATEFDGSNFVNGDYTTLTIGVAGGTWEIQVEGSVAGAPTGSYIIDETGTTSGDAP